jgi:hypothetical protein
MQDNQLSGILDVLQDLPLKDLYAPLSYLLSANLFTYISKSQYNII